MFFKQQKQAQKHAEQNCANGADLFYHTMRSAYFILPIVPGESEEDRAARLSTIVDAKPHDARFIKRIYPL